MTTRTDTRTEPQADNSRQSNSTRDSSSGRLRRIRALLAKAENTPYPDEADAYMAKVGELVARWGIDEALLWAAAETTDREEVTSTTITVEAPYANRKALLVNEVALGVGCKAVVLAAGGEQQIAIVGFAGDVARAEILITSLSIQLTRALLAGGTQYDATTTAAWRRSFITSYATRIGERLTASRTEAAHTATQPATGTSTSTELVLAGRDEAVQAALTARFGRLRNRRISSGGHRGGSNAGRSAANRATLDDSELRSPTAIGR